MSKIVEEQIRRAKRAIDTALGDPDMLKSLAMFTYNKQKLLKGKALYQALDMLDAQQKKEYGEQFDATDALKEAKEEAKAMYMKHLRIARFALIDRGIWNALQLPGARSRSTFGWLRQASIFYDNIGPATEILKKYDLLPEELAQGKAMIQAVEEAYNRQQKEQIEAVESTARRTEAEVQLSDWMTKYEMAAQLALENAPQKLQILGFTPLNANARP